MRKRLFRKRMNAMKRMDRTIVIFRVTAMCAALIVSPGAIAKEAAELSALVPAMWEYTAPLISPEKRDKEPSVAQKDPSVVFYAGRWHVFMTVKLPGRAAIEYCSFAKWEDADQAPRTTLTVCDSKYVCAPQVFYFEPQKKWYLVYQAKMGSHRNFMWVAYSTTENIADPASWTQAQPILDGSDADPRQEGGLDYWIICDEQRAYLFLTNDNGKLWRLWTNLKDFPKGFSHCELALQCSLYEASHTYRLKGLGKFLTIVEENGRKKFYTAYLADSLDGKWTPLADTEEKPFAGAANIRPAASVKPWTENVSHGEMIREGCDETETIDPGNLRFLFQGMFDSGKAGKGYDDWRWRLGILTPAGNAKPPQP